MSQSHSSAALFNQTGMSGVPPRTNHGRDGTSGVADLNFDFAGIDRKADKIALASGRTAGRTDVFSMLKSERNSVYGVSE